uniref:Uncharacterized protein n=1 Tax=Spongospora subterranea TaxID=70186 RepID=A0A0H5QLR9_9EUKA|eukprot:CRZ02286.1 hypothetical protein [Spongospora subterranea]
MRHRNRQQSKRGVNGQEESSNMPKENCQQNWSHTKPKRIAYISSIFCLIYNFFFSRVVVQGVLLTFFRKVPNMRTASIDVVQVAAKIAMEGIFSLRIAA